MTTPKETDPTAEPTAQNSPLHAEAVRAIQADNAEGVNAVITTSVPVAAAFSSGPTGGSKRSTGDLLVGAVAAITPTDEVLPDAQEFLEREDATKEELIRFMSGVTARANRDTAWKGLLDRAWHKFLGCQPTNDELRDVLKSVALLRDEAWEEFLRRQPEPRDLVLVTACGVEVLQDRAWNHILQSDITLEQSDYLFLMGKYRKCEPRIGAELLKRYPDDEFCCYGVLAKTDNEDLRNQAWSEFLQNDPSYDLLLQIMHQVEPLREQAARVVLARRDADNDDLVSIVQLVAPLRRDAWDKLRNQNPSDDNLTRIIEFVPSLRGEVSECVLERHPDLNNRIRELEPILQPEQLVWELLMENHDLWALHNALPYIVAHRADGKSE